MPDDEPISVEDWATSMHPLADTSIIIMSVTVLEGWVEAALLTKMRNLSNTLKDRLFQGYGPLSSFSAKIDVGYALHLFNEQTFNDLRALKDIRNAFAHTVDPLHFKSTTLIPVFQKLKGWTKNSNPHQLFRDRVHACAEELKLPLDQKGLIDALLARAEDAKKPAPTILSSSPEKS